MNLRNLKIGNKLGLSFTLLLLLTVLVGVLSIFEMRHINHSTTEMSGRWLPILKQVGELQAVLNDMRRAELQHVVATSAADKQQEEERLSSNIRKLQETQEKLAAQLPDVGSWQAVFARYQQDSRAYLATTGQLVALSKVGPEGLAATTQYLRGESRVKFRAIFQSLNELGALSSQETQDIAQQANQTYFSARFNVSLALGAAVGVALVLVWWLSRQITHPIQTAVQAAQSFASGDLSRPLETSGSDELAQLLRVLEGMRVDLAKVVADVRTGAEQVASASIEIAQGNQNLSDRTEQQASALEQTAASMAQLSSMVAQNATSALEANRLATSASAVAAHGCEVVEEVVHTMQGIDESSKKIADIINVIDGVAFQTNILALNAAVEAARAGEQGRGFAVVAGEVRTLASRTAQAARDIKALITTSVERVQQGTALVDKAGHTMTDVADTVQRVTQLMGAISTASNEQATGVAQAGEAITEMDQTTQQNAALVEEMAAAASGLRSQAQQLVQTVAIFHLEGARPGALLPTH